MVAQQMEAVVRRGHLARSGDSSSPRRPCRGERSVHSLPVGLVAPCPSAPYPLSSHSSQRIVPQILLRLCLPILKTHQLPPLHLEVI